MKFEVCNPSDQCFVDADDPRVAVACILYLGAGQYPTRNADTGESLAGSFFALGGDVEETWKHFYGIGFDAFVCNKENQIKMAASFDSFRYAYERTSMNNIGERAKQLSISLRKGIEAEHEAH